MEESTAIGKPAGFWIRLAAFLVDWLLLAGLSVLFFGSEVVDRHGTPWSFTLHYTNLQVLLPLGYFLGFWLWRAATPGKMIFRLVIVDAGGGPLTWRQAVVRLVAMVPSLLFFGLGCLWIAGNRQKQGWHDRIASTMVVRT